MTRKKMKTKKCPTCKGTGRVKIDKFGRTKEDYREEAKLWKKMED